MKCTHYTARVHVATSLLLAMFKLVQVLFACFFLVILRLSCTTSAAGGAVAGPVQLRFRDATGTPRNESSVQPFSFRDLTITAVSPITGIAAGGTVLTLSGLSLLVRSTHRVTVGGQECAVVRWVGLARELLKGIQPSCGIPRAIVLYLVQVSP